MGKRIAVIAGVLIVLVVALGQCSNSAADIEQARAAIESAKAAQEAARAANTAAAGLTMVAGGQTAILLMLVAALVATWMGIGYLVFRRLTADRGRQTGDGGRQTGDRRQLTEDRLAVNPAGVDMSQLAQLMTLRILADLAGGQKQSARDWQPMIAPEQLPAGDDDDGGFPW